MGRAQAGRCLRTSSSASCRGKNFLLRSKLFCQFSISINFRRHVMLACYFHPKHDLSQGEGDETAMLLYTSGATSGSPRGVTLSHSILGRQVINCLYHVCCFCTSLPVSILGRPINFSCTVNPPPPRSSELLTLGTGVRRTVFSTASGSVPPMG